MDKVFCVKILAQLIKNAYLDFEIYFHLFYYAIRRNSTILAAKLKKQTSKAIDFIFKNVTYGGGQK